MRKLSGRNAVLGLIGIHDAACTDEYDNFRMFGSAAKSLSTNKYHRNNPAYLPPSLQSSGYF